MIRSEPRERASSGRAVRLEVRNGPVDVAAWVRSISLRPCMYAPTHVDARGVVMEQADEHPHVVLVPRNGQAGGQLGGEVASVVCGHAERYPPRDGNGRRFCGAAAPGLPPTYRQEFVSA
jgi:hypothetical protein